MSKNNRFTISAMSLVLAACATWAERDFEKHHPGCSEALKVEAVGDGWFGVTRGCGQVQFRLLSTKGDPNRGGELIGEVVERYGFETKCPQDQLSFKRLQEDAFGISGCGYATVYKHIQNVGWITDSVARPAE